MLLTLFLKYEVCIKLNWQHLYLCLCDSSVLCSHSLNASCLIGRRAKHIMGKVILQSIQVKI